MAEWTTKHRSFRDSISKASGDADEIFCEPCINRGKSIAVEGFCQICHEYMCDSCLEVHKNQKMSRNHTILDKTQLPTKQEDDTSQGICTEVCETHRPEIIRFYCKAHNVAGCGDCMTLDHGTCKKERVQDISKGFQTTKEFKQMQQKLSKFDKELNTIKDTLKGDLKNLNSTFDTIQQKITSFRKEINDYLDKMQKQLTEEADNLKKKLGEEINTLITESKSMKSEVEGINQRIQNDTNDETTLFVLTKQANQRLVRIEKELTKMKQTKRQEKLYAFRSSSELESFILAKTPMGKLVRKPNVNTQASHQGNINVKCKGEQMCCVKECTLITPDRMVITDGDNKKIKLIDIHNKAVVSSYSTTSVPEVITTVNDHQIAVSFIGGRQIELFNVTSELTPLRQIIINTPENDKFTFAYKDGKFALSFVKSKRVEIIDLHGNVVHRIQPRLGNTDYLQGGYNVLFGHDNDTVIVSDYRTNKVSVVSFEGQVLQTYTHGLLKRPLGIELTADGVQFVCSKDTGCIHVVSPDFKTSKIIINNDDNTPTPVSIAYCDVNYRLYVVNNIAGKDPRNNLLQVYDLHV